MQNIKNKGFTLIELLVVIAIVAILASITMGYLSGSKAKGLDTGVKSNISTVRALSEIFYLDNGNSYLPAGGSNFSIAACPTYDASGTNMFSKNKTIAEAIAEAGRRGTGTACANAAEVWAVAIGLNTTPNTVWCADNEGAAKVLTGTPASAINSSTFLCN